MLVVIRPQSLPASGLLVTDGRFGGELEIKGGSMNIMVNNGVAVTELEQNFVKEGKLDWGGTVHVPLHWKGRCGQHQDAGQWERDDRQSGWKEVGVENCQKLPSPTGFFGPPGTDGLHAMGLRINFLSSAVEQRVKVTDFKNSISSTIQPFMFIHGLWWSHHPTIGSRQNRYRYQLRYKC